MSDQPGNEEGDVNDARNVHKTEQSMAAMLDLFPRMWWGLFARLKEEGFNDQQALELVKTYIQSLAK